MFTHENPWQLQNTNFRTDLEASIYPQELSNHTIILFCNISERFNYFSPWILQHWLPSVNNASRYTDGSFFYKYWLFIKLQKMEGEVFIALGTSHGDFEPPRASISPQSPPSLKPAMHSAKCKLLFLLHNIWFKARFATINFVSWNLKVVRWTSCSFWGVF